MKRMLLSAIVALGVIGFAMPVSAKPAADNKGQATKAAKSKGAAKKAVKPPKVKSNNKTGAKHPKGVDEVPVTPAP